jgi:hypothetical protein
MRLLVKSWNNGSRIIGRSTHSNPASCANWNNLLWEGLTTRNGGCCIGVRKGPAQVPSPRDIQVPVGVFIRECQEKIARAHPRVAGRWSKGKRQQVVASIAWLGQPERGKIVIIELSHSRTHATYREKQGFSFHDGQGAALPILQFLTDDVQLFERHQTSGVLRNACLWRRRRAEGGFLEDELLAALFTQAAHHML